MKRLLQIYEGIERRTSQFPSWPCRRGCDHCCRSLAEPMLITRAEWELLRLSIGEYVPTSDPRVCPFLDTEEGACRVYAHRPAACRTHGYYVERGVVLGCSQILAREDDDVVWGNEESVRQALATLSDDSDDAGALPLLEWLALDSSRPSSSM